MLDGVLATVDTVRTYATSFEAEHHINNRVLRLQGKVDVYSPDALFELKTKYNQYNQYNYNFQLVSYLANEMLENTQGKERKIRFDILGILQNMESRFFKRGQATRSFEELEKDRLVRMIFKHMLIQRNITVLYWHNFELGVKVFGL